MSIETEDALAILGKLFQKKLLNPNAEFMPSGLLKDNQIIVSRSVYERLQKLKEAADDN